MSLGLLGVIIAAGLLGPLLRSWRILRFPVAVGEIAIGSVLGSSGFDVLPTNDSTFKFLALIGFALLMLTAGSHIKFEQFKLRLIPTVIFTLATNLLISLVLALVLSRIVHFHHWGLFFVILLSSSAAFVIPIVESRKPSTSISRLILQVTIADVLAFVILPFVVQSSGRLSSAFGSIVVLAISIAIYWTLKFAKERGYLERAHKKSKAERLGIELRVSLALLLLLSSLAMKVHSSLLVASFSLGVALATVGVPRRLSRQLFGISEGFFSPLYFIWLGASIDIHGAFQSGEGLALIFLLTTFSILSHSAGRFFGQSYKEVLLASAQLGIPAAVVTLGQANGLLTQSESGAIMVSALLTMLIAGYSERREMGKK
jgi:Kef-type K+ transport system membrane component KefB